jgi:thymidylate synthase (FAD)
MNHYKVEDLKTIVSPPAAVCLISRPQFLNDEFQNFLVSQKTFWKHDDKAKDPELLVEAAGRLCYMSFGHRQYRQDNKSYIDHLIAEGHDSVLEHATWSLLITGVSRAFTHQLVRHRIGFSFSQLSQQYHDESDALFVPPAEIRAEPDALELWADSMKRAREAYKKILSRLAKEARLGDRELKRAIRSAARSTLPNCTETKIVVTANARALRHFLAVRGAIMGDLEMRQISAKVLQLMNSEAPSLFADFCLEESNDGFPLVKRKTDSITF